MSIIKHIKNKIVQWQYSRIVKSLTATSPEKIIQGSEKRLISAFRHTAKRVPFYEKLIRDNGIDPAKITSLDQFNKKVPFIDKQTVFQANKLVDICLDGHINDISLVYSSSGYSGVFSFGAETWDNRSDVALGLEFLLDNAFGIFSQKTFIINCLPMGVKVFTRSVPVADTSVREDVVLALIMKLKDQFDQFILIGESSFLKKVVEDGIIEKIPWKDIKVNLITGGEYISETYRSYMGKLLGIDFKDSTSGLIAVNMGLSELSLSVFCENFETIQLRQATLKDEKLRTALFGDQINYSPLIMQYFPQQTWLETVPDEHDNPELVVSMLNTNLKIPLIRYNTGDWVKLLSYEDMQKITDRHGYAGLMPKFKLPFGIIYGKKLSVVSKGNKEITVNAIKEALFENFIVAENITGNFKLLIEDKEPKLLVQLKPGTDSISDLNDLLLESLIKYTSTRIQIELIPYFNFPYGIEHNFEKKNQYLKK